MLCSLASIFDLLPAVLGNEYLFPANTFASLEGENFLRIKEKKNCKAIWDKFEGGVGGTTLQKRWSLYRNFFLHLLKSFFQTWSSIFTLKLQLVVKYGAMSGPRSCPLWHEEIHQICIPPGRWNRHPQHSSPVDITSGGTWHKCHPSLKCLRTTLLCYSGHQPNWPLNQRIWARNE